LVERDDGGVRRQGHLRAKRGSGRISCLPLRRASCRLTSRAEASRVASVQQLLGTASPGLDQFTTDPLFKDVWLRPDLSPRDRSLVTITSLMANGQVAQLAGHLNRALNNGLTPEQAGEVVTQIAFYAGWPNAFSAGPVVAEVFRSRSK
jgi:4-carboxymuconolactone decarboxylase